MNLSGLVGLTGLIGGLLLVQRRSLEPSDPIQMGSGGLETRLRWGGRGGAVESNGEEAGEEKGEKNDLVIQVEGTFKKRDAQCREIPVKPLLSIY